MKAFDPAIAALAKDGARFSQPESFQGYCERNQISAQRTAQMISVDSLSRLSPELKAAGMMVFRLGKDRSEGTTRFGLASNVGGWKDYFIDDRDVFDPSRCPITPFVPEVSNRTLFSFRLLPEFTETSFVNLAIASGALSFALGLESKGENSVPATGQSVFTFKFRPHRQLDTVWDHIQGQVEIDAVFVAHRGGTPIVIVLEAKSGGLDTLAKHKLAYPVLAVRPNVPSYMDIVPVYLRAYRHGNECHFLVAECSFGPKENEIAAISDLNVTRAVHVTFLL